MSRASQARHAQAALERGVQRRQQREARELQLEELPGRDRLRRPGPTGGAPTPLGAVIASIAPAPRILPLPPLPAHPRLALQRERIRRFDELDTELGALLATCAPDTWAEARRALRRILRSARRELRALERQLQHPLPPLRVTHRGP